MRQENTGSAGTQATTLEQLRIDTVSRGVLDSSGADPGRSEGRARVGAHLLAGIAVGFATIDVVGGFLVTHRMLHMFRKKS
jgi:hypothetical protein